MMKRIFTLPVILFALASVMMAEEEQQSAALPLLVEPPVSQGWNEGFSREPMSPAFHKKENILVTESIGATKRHSGKGNNRVFNITEYFISPDGTKMQITCRAVFEGTARLANEENFSLACLEPYTFRMDDGDSAFRIYKARFSTEGELESLMVFYHDGSVPAEPVGHCIYRK